MIDIELNKKLLAGEPDSLVLVNEQLEAMSASERVNWALRTLPGQQVLSSSFGIQSAAMLHLVTTAANDINVVLVDTGYLFPETYRFIDTLTECLKLNLKVYRSAQSSSWQEAQYGKLWDQGLDGLNRYNQINKVVPMKQALRQLEVGTWYAGLRREQASSRNKLSVLRIQDGRFKMHPIIDWTNRDVHQYLMDHNLPYHPLWEQGYVSVGDHHSSQPLHLGMTEEETRFSGLKRECGLHE